MKKSRLAVIGAGPKGLAIAAKNKVLTELGFQTPEVILIEKTGVASHWTGRSGYTDGQLELGTSPEKDLGFPYNTRSFSPKLNEEINRRMMAFSWAHYLMAAGTYSEYIDRGKPSPTHSQFAEYLNWVAHQVLGSTRIVFGEVFRIDFSSAKSWKISAKTSEKSSNETPQESSTQVLEIEAEGLVLTGPGLARADFPILGGSRVYDIESFWREKEKLVFRDGERVCLVGAGENSASIAAALTAHSKVEIDIVSPSGFVFSRGESYLENRVYSHPELGPWDRLTEEDKMNFIRRTDLSVFGQYMQSLLNKRRGIHLVPGRVTAAESLSENKVQVEVCYDGFRESRSYDHMIVATGFDQLQFLREALTGPAKTQITQALGLSSLCQEELARRIGSDMAVEGLSRKLHLPMLSRLRQGPGFANLSSLGSLSDHILESYVSSAKISLNPQVLEAV